MRYVDLVTLTISGGHGGAGASCFSRKKFEPKGGPSGGDGGDGGDIYLRVNPDLRSLLDFKNKALYKAQNGQPGSKEKKHGSKGRDLILEVPLGSLVKDSNGVIIADLNKKDSHICIAKGGRGGLGNTHFARSTHQSPSYAQQGLPGEHRDIIIELRTLADCGLVGLPNAGKSTLLKLLTDAKVKIGDYAFTTRYPNLGILKLIDRHITLADVPGLISGASKGAGLGHDFLRHLSRTQCLIHVIPADENPKICIKHYETIYNELSQSVYQLESFPTLLVLSKSDLISADTLSKIFLEFQNKGLPSILAVSKEDPGSIHALKEAISNIVKDS